MLHQFLLQDAGDVEVYLVCAALIQGLKGHVWPCVQEAVCCGADLHGATLYVVWSVELTSDL